MTSPPTISTTFSAYFQASMTISKEPRGMTSGPASWPACLDLFMGAFFRIEACILFILPIACIGSPGCMCTYASASSLTSTPLLDTHKGIALNKGNICIGKSSHSLVLEAYSEQFERDFSLFISSRAQEIVRGGKMVLTVVGRTNPDPTSKECSCVAELVAKALSDIVSEGIVEEPKVDSFNLPCYPPSTGEVKCVIEREGSFDIKRLETFEISWDPSIDQENGSSFASDGYQSSLKVSRFVRSVLEPVLVSHFGETIMEGLFEKHRKKVANHMARERAKHVNIVIALTKRG